MYNSIQQFNENGVKKIEEVIREFLINKGMDIGELVIGLNQRMQELLCNIVSEIIEGIDQAYRESDERKQKYHIERSRVKNCFTSTCGDIKYQRTYYKNKQTGELKYLADEACGITKNMRKSNDVVAECINHAIDSSYRISGEHATNTDDKSVNSQL